MKTQLKNAVARTGNIAKSTYGKASLIGVGMVTGTTAALASDTGGASSAASTAFSQLQSQASDMAGQAWPVVTAIVGSLLAIGLFKKFANRAT